MTDTFNKKERSRIMASVRSRGNSSTELKVLRILSDNKIKGWRRHWRVEGSPDFAFPKFKVALFIDGCFWHGCARCYSAPKTSQAYWEAKILRNKQRDLNVSRSLKKIGWKVLRIKECQLKFSKRVLWRIKNILHSCVSSI